MNIVNHRVNQEIHRGLSFALLTCALAFPAGCASSHDSSSSTAHGDPLFDAAADRPAAPRTLYTLSRILVRQGRTADAQRLLHEALQQSKTYAPAYAALAELEINAGQVDSALRLLRKGVAACPKEAVLHNNLGMCFLLKGDYELALQSFSRAVELDALVARYRANRAMAMGLLGRYEQCLSAYSTVVTKAEAHHNLAILCRMRGDTERADAESQQALAASNASSPATQPAAVSTAELVTPAPMVRAASPEEP